MISCRLYRCLWLCNVSITSFSKKWVFLVNYSKMPEHEDDHLTPATRLLEKRREMAEVEQALAAQKEVCQSHS